MEHNTHVEVFFDAQGKTSTVPNADSWDNLRGHLDEHPPFANHIRSRIFSYGPSIETNYESTISREFSSRGFNHIPGIFKHLHSTEIDYETRLDTVRCRCLNCTDGQPCGRELLDLSIGICSVKEADDEPSYRRYVPRHRHGMKSARSAGKKCLYSGDLITFPGTTLPGSTLPGSTSVNVFGQSSNDILHRLAGIRPFGDISLWENVGIKIAPNTYRLCASRNKAAEQFLSGEVLDETLGVMDRKLVHKLVKYAQIWDQFLRMQQQQVKVFQEVLDSASGEGSIWFRFNQSPGGRIDSPLSPRNSGLTDSIAVATTGNLASADSTQTITINIAPRPREDKNSPRFKLKAAMEELANVGTAIETSLVKETRELIERTHNIISIDEAYRSRDMNESIKRLSWVTFIFLPLVFVASLFGMNIDILQDNPSWTYYLIFSVPMFFLIMVSVMLLKKWGQLTAALGNLITVLTHRKRLGSVLRWLVKSVITRQRIKAFRAWLLKLLKYAMLKRELSDEEKDAVNKRDEQLIALAGYGDLEEVRRLYHEGANVESLEVNRDGPTALQAAARRGHQKIVQKLIQYKANVNAPAGNIDGRTALQAAAEKHLKIVEILLYLGADVNAPPGPVNGRTALQAAAEGGELDIVELLILRGAIVNAPAGDTGGRTALQAAAEGGHLKIVKRLLNPLAGVNLLADVNAAPARVRGRTALESAASQGHKDIVELLVSHGAKAVEIEGFMALRAAAGGGYPEVIEILISKNGQINYFGDLLHVAAYGGHQAVVKLLISKGADINAQIVNANVQNRVDTALMMAAERGHKDIVKLLIDEGAVLDNALQVATIYGHKDIVELLISKGAPQNDRTAALLKAAMGGREEITTLLIKSGARIDEAGADGFTALQIAVSMGQNRTVELLIEAGANINAPPADAWGRTALQAAAETGQRQIVEMLLDKGADINAGPAATGGRTALQAAAGRGHLEIAYRLINLGANVNAEPAATSGRTALQAAAGAGHFWLIHCLIGAGADINAAPAVADGCTALRAATEGGHQEIISLLSNNGAVINTVPPPHIVQPGTPMSPTSFVQDFDETKGVSDIRGVGTKEFE